MLKIGDHTWIADDESVGVGGMLLDDGQQDQR